MTREKPSLMRKFREDLSAGQTELDNKRAEIQGTNAYFKGKNMKMSRRAAIEKAVKRGNKNGNT